MGFLDDLLLLDLSRHEKLHVRLAQFAIRLNQLNDANQSTLLSEITGDDEFAVAARYLLAVNKKTASNVLKSLAEDDYPHIAEAAKSNQVKNI